MGDISHMAIVFGGSGFLGSHVADELTARNYAVRVFDRVPSPYLDPSQEMIVGDITDNDAVREAVSGCQYVFNFASIGDIEEANAAPLAAAEVNVKGTVASLDASVAAKARRYVLASSVYVYSRSGGIYKASKQSAEAFVEAYADEFDLPFTILRYGSLYGRRAGPYNTIRRFIEQCISSGQITYHGTEEAVREYIHVKDAAKLSVDILQEQYAQRHILLTGSERMLVREVMQMIAEIAPQEPRLQIEPSQSKLHYSLTPYNYQPRIGHKLVAQDYVDLGQGILDCIEEYFEQNDCEEHARQAEA